MRIPSPNQKDTYANTTGLIVNFIVGNTGSIPAKNVKIDLTGKIGNVILRRIEPSSDEGFIVPSQGKFSISSFIEKNDLKRLVEDGEKLIYSIKISYSDFKGYEPQEYTSYSELELVAKDPPGFLVHPVARNKWEKTSH
jgi:hypothetical protein